jgi:hypothetical protein
LKLLDVAIGLRSIIAEIDCDVTLYIVDPSAASNQERYRIFRRHGARLNAAAWKVLGYSYFEDLLQLPPREDVLKAANELLNLAIFDADSDSAPTVVRLALDSEKNNRELLRPKRSLGRSTWVKGNDSPSPRPQASEPNSGGQPVP